MELMAVCPETCWKIWRTYSRKARHAMAGDPGEDPATDMSDVGQVVITNAARAPNAVGTCT